MNDLEAEWRGDLPATPVALDSAAEITPADIEAAQEFARHFFSPLMLAMLNAKPEPEAMRHREG